MGLTSSRITDPPQPPKTIGNTDPNTINPPIRPAATKTTSTAASNTATTSTASTALAPAVSLSGTAPFAAVLDGSGTTDGSSPITRWVLRFGDGTTAKGAGPPGAVTHTYTASGTYHASLSVFDQSGASAVAKASISVAPASPTVWISGDQPLGFDTLSEKFNASQSSSGNWTISFGDGTPDLTGSGRPPASVAHNFTTVGIYTTTLTVTDLTTGLSNVARAISTVSASRAPTAQTKAPDVGPTSASLGADLWTNGRPTTFHFEWGTDPNNLVNITSIRTAKLGASSPAQSISGLTQGTTYYFRVVASNSVGTTNGVVLPFTPASGPKIFTVSATNIGPDQATLQGLINTEGSDTQAWFEWGPDATLGFSTPPQDIGSVRGQQTVAATITGLQPSTTYSYRFVGQNLVGQTASHIFTFNTTAAAFTPAPAAGAARSGTRW